MMNFFIQPFREIIGDFIKKGKIFLAANSCNASCILSPPGIVYTKAFFFKPKLGLAEKLKIPPSGGVPSKRVGGGYWENTIKSDVPVRVFRPPPPGPAPPPTGGDSPDFRHV